MGSKNPPIQVLMADFADEHAESLLYVEEYDAYYWLNSKKHYYEPLSKDKMTVKLAKYLEPRYEGSITNAIFTNALIWLKVKVKKKMKQINSSLVIFRDSTTLNLYTLEVRPYDRKKDRIFFYINCKFPTKKSKCPNFLNFLSQVLVDQKTQLPDPELLQVVQEMFGYYLLSTQEPPVAFFLLGSGSNGKSTLMLVLEQLVGGEQFIMSNSLDNLTGKNFHVQELRFKRLNICAEEQSTYLKTGNFKTLTEGARMHAEIKFGDQISITPKTKHIFLTNKMPKFDDAGYAIKRRVQILPFYRQFLAHETDKQLKTREFKDSKFAKELPAIVAWAIEGAKRLIKQNYTFTVSTQAQATYNEYERDISSTLNFWRENFIYTGTNMSDATFFSTERLYRLYKAWCHQNNRKSVSASNFRHELKQELKISEFKPGHDTTLEVTTARGVDAILSKESTLLSAEYSYMFKDYKEHIDDEDED